MSTRTLMVSFSMGEFEGGWQSSWEEFPRRVCSLPPTYSSSSGNSTATMNKLNKDSARDAKWWVRGLVHPGVSIRVKTFSIRSTIQAENSLMVNEELQAPKDKKQIL